MTPRSSGAGEGALLYVQCFLVGLLAWLLCHPYQGLFHDANLYALQALARINPDSLSHDIFLSHGSQDRFTLFSPLYAGVIRLLGLDRAAALLTLLSQMGICGAAWVLARTRLPPAGAAAGVVLLLALPCQYGPLRVFSCIEPFLTPRMAAEALTLGALAAALRGQRVLAVTLGTLGLLLHPVMALAGISAWIAWQWLPVWQRRPWRAIGIAASLLIAGLAGALLVGGRFDSDWLTIVQSRSPYLFINGWHSEDVSRAMTGLLPLAAGAVVFDEPLQRACQSVFVAAVAGWALTFVGADLLHAVLMTQVQPWRIEWLAIAASALLLPQVLAVLWRGGAGRRAAALLIIAALIFDAQSYSMLIGIAALVLLRPYPRNPRYANLIFYGAVALFMLAAIWRVASNLEFTDQHYLDGTWPGWLRQAMSFVKDGAAPGAVVLAQFWLNRRRIRVVGLSLLLIIGSVLLVGIARFTAGDWLTQAYPPQRIADFEAWRAQVPPHAQVFWSDSPLAAWTLLQRANYLSGLQSSGVVFSEAGALELKHRAEGLAPLIAPANFLQWDFIEPRLPVDAGTLRSVCRLGVIDFIVTESDIGLTPVGTLAASQALRPMLRLYRCADRS